MFDYRINRTKNRQILGSTDYWFSFVRLTSVLRQDIKRSCQEIMILYNGLTCNKHGYLASCVVFSRAL